MSEDGRGAVRRWHGVFVVLVGAAIPVGEGLAFAALGAVLLLLVLRHREVRWGIVESEESRLVLVSLLAWLLFGLAALVLGGEGWQKPGELGRWSPYLALPLALWSSTCLPRQVWRRAAVAFVALLVVACLFALLQYTFNVRPGEALSRVDSTIATQGRIPGHFNATVAGGFYYHRLKMAHVLVLGIGVMFARQMFLGLSLRRRAIELAVLALFATTCVLTYSRGALLALLGGALACLPFASRRWRLTAVAGLVVACALAFAHPAVRARIDSIGSAQASSVRALIWSQGARIIADHPLGVGLGNYPVIVGRYYDTADPSFTVRTYPHNIWLAAWAETGPLGLAAYALAWAAFALLCIRHVRRADSEAQAAAAAGLFGIVGMAVIGFTHDVLFHNAVALAFAGLCGWVLAVLVGPADPQDAAG